MSSLQLPETESGRPAPTPRGRDSVSVVAPVLREAANLEPLVRAVAATLEPAGLEWELLFVDDDSRDGSGEIARGLARDFPVRFEVRLAWQRDLSLSVLQGVRLAKFDRVVVTDADLSHPPDRIPDLLEALDKGVIAVGSRYASGASLDPNWSTHGGGWSRKRRPHSRRR